jgi:hypothetical protein
MRLWRVIHFSRRFLLTRPSLPLILNGPQEPGLDLRLAYGDEQTHLMPQQLIGPVRSEQFLPKFQLCRPSKTAVHCSKIGPQ